AGARPPRRRRPQLISSVEPARLRLTRLDERIYGEFRRCFGSLRVDRLDPEELKSEEAKAVRGPGGHAATPGASACVTRCPPQKWRPFCLHFEGLVEDFNLGTLLRLDCREGYSEENTIFATRIQFLAIEIARNREGCNDVVYNGAVKPAPAGAPG
ncbi:PBDC1 protein, partial [Eudromia elegans]|nr:PBDC1 protein [Eudromia elegans]